MENAKWNGKEIFAMNVASDYEYEKAIRIASMEKQLTCADEDCAYPVVRYCHGEKKGPYFAHLINCECDYAKYEKEKNTTVFSCVKKAFYDHLKSKGYNVRFEKKVAKGHYADLVVEINGEKIAIEFGDNRTSVKTTERVERYYDGKEYKVNWVVIDDDQLLADESATYYIKRYCLNESANEDVLQVNFTATDVVQYTVDNDTYSALGRKNVFGNSRKFFKMSAPIDKLVIKNGYLTIEGFDEKYKAWKVEKQRKFFELVEQLKREDELEKARNQERIRQERLREEQEKRLRIQRRIEREEEKRRKEAAWKERQAEEAANRKKDEEEKRIKEAQATKEKEEIALGRAEVSDKFVDASVICVEDSYGRRWRKCVRCRKIELEEKMFKVQENVAGKCIKCAATFRI